MRRAALVTFAVLVAQGAAGCGVLIDVVGRPGNKRFPESSTESKPIAQTRVAVEYEAVLQPDRTVALTCIERERPVERAWTMTRVYQRRGSYERDTYVATAVLSAVTGALVTGVTALCLHEENDWSCWGMLAGSPFALDVGYSTYRALTAKPAKLVDKRTSPARLRYGEVPLHEQVVACDPAARLVLATVRGPDAEAVLNGALDAREVVEVSAELPVDPADGRIDFGADGAALVGWQQWGPRLQLIDAAGTPHPVAADRCAILRAHAPRDARDLGCALPTR